MLPLKYLEAERKHAVAFVSLLVVTLLPVPFGIGFLGKLLQAHFPSPFAGQILLGAVLMIGALPLLMLFGAAVWLAVARHFVPRAVAERFFLYPGLGVLSIASKWLFELAYGEAH